MKVIVGLGNPGPRYDSTRHNVGWWALDRLAYDWNFPVFELAGSALESQGTVGDHEVRLMKPSTYMNRSGRALGVLAAVTDFEFTNDLMIVVDDAALDVGQLRLRPSGSSGGHNGLKSISEVLGSDEYPRLRIGVGRKPAGVDLSDWVLSDMPEQDERAVVELLPEVTEALGVWLSDGIAVAMDRHNR